MKIYKQKYKNTDAISAENDKIILTVFPQLGAKIASIFYKPQNYEILFQPTLNKYKMPKYDDDFSLYDTSGIDEMFPNIDRCIYPYDNYKNTLCPDHGEIWSIPWTLKENQEYIETETKGRKFPYLINRKIKIIDNEIFIKYKITNVGSHKLYGIWAFHGLLNCDEKSKIILPGINKVTNINKNSRFLGPKDNELTFPEFINKSNQIIRLDRIRAKEANNCEKYYASGKNETASLIQNNGKLLYNISFPYSQIPYIGIWINEGKFKNEHNVAIEPTNGYYDSLEITNEKNGLIPINPDDELKWWIRIRLEEI